MYRIASAALSLLLVVLLCSCSGAPEGRKGKLRSVTALMQEVIRTGPVTVRHNPVACDCPAFEIWLNGSWVRTEISSPTPEIAITSLFAQPPQASAPIVLTLTLDSSKGEFCPNGTLFFRTTYVAPEPTQEPENAP